MKHAHLFHVVRKGASTSLQPQLPRMRPHVQRYLSMHELQFYATVLWPGGWLVAMSIFAPTLLLPVPCLFVVILEGLWKAMSFDWACWMSGCGTSATTGAGKVARSRRSPNTAGRASKCLVLSVYIFLQSDCHAVHSSKYMSTPCMTPAPTCLHISRLSDAGGEEEEDSQTP